MWLFERRHVPEKSPRTGKITADLVTLPNSQCSRFPIRSPDLVLRTRSAANAPEDALRSSTRRTKRRLILVLVGNTRERPGSQYAIKLRLRRVDVVGPAQKRWKCRATEALVGSDCAGLGYAQAELGHSGRFPWKPSRSVTARVRERPGSERSSLASAVELWAPAYIPTLSRSARLSSQHLNQRSCTRPHSRTHPRRLSMQRALRPRVPSESRPTHYESLHPSHRAAHQER
jgi:hypothetical protein